MLSLGEMGGGGDAVAIGFVAILPLALRNLLSAVADALADLLKTLDGLPGAPSMRDGDADPLLGTLVHGRCTSGLMSEIRRECYGVSFRLLLFLDSALITAIPVILLFWCHCALYASVIYISVLHPFLFSCSLHHFSIQIPVFIHLSTLDS